LPGRPGKLKTGAYFSSLLDGIRQIVDGEAQTAEGSFDMSPRSLHSAISMGITPPETIPFTAQVTITWQIEPR